MPAARVEVCRLGAGDWQAYRAVRLAMLEESPEAFGSTLAEGRRLDEQAWRRRLEDNVVFVARLGGEAVGSAMYSDWRATVPGEAFLVGMWLAPAARGSGAAERLVRAVLSEAAARDRVRVLLDVVDTNTAARRLYERCGFVPTGVSAPYPHDSARTEVQMEHRLPAEVRGPAERRRPVAGPPTGAVLNRASLEP